MALLRKLAALGAAAEAARRYAQSNPDKVREIADKAAAFADQQTKGKYSKQINSAKQAVTGAAGISRGGPGSSGGQVIYPPEQPRPAAPRPTPYKRG
jgi:hypothetical protein